ncbi:MAG: plastocyanin/azurin family copper-binding protein [Actinomycetota bacterium]|nr:plastocyanin/azurin family copper-binding protein [Actinomycetota bacterium]
MRRRLSLLLVLALGSFWLVLPGAAAGGGCHAMPGNEMTSSNRQVVAIGECAFVDTVTYVQPGDEVTWVNKDPVPHSVSGAAYSWGTEDLLNRGERVSYTFEDEGVYPYYCVLHPSMVGAVVVGDATEAAVLTNGVAGVDKVDEGAAATSPRDSGGIELSSAILGVSAALALGALFVVSRLAFRRRAGATPAA